MIAYLEATALYRILLFVNSDYPCNLFDSGVLVLIDMFQSYMRKLTVVRSSVLTAGESDESSSCTKDAQIFQVFETLEVLLLFSGSVLTPTMREEIEICVGQGMYVRLFIFLALILLERLSPLPDTLYTL